MASLRSKVYEILSVCFVYPDHESFSYMTRGMLQDLKAYLTKMPHMKIAARSFESFESALEAEAAKGKLQDLQVEHTSAFISPHPEIPCPPYESIYVENVRRVMGPPAIDVRRRYEEQGLAISKGFKDLPDHISAELEFMHHLAYREAQVKSTRKDRVALSLRENEKSFLTDHLLKWLPRFADCLRGKSTSSLLVAASRLASEFAMADLKYIEDLSPQASNLSER
jgi:DMSO reductase family type II enzyme chaperone